VHVLWVLPELGIPGGRKVVLLLHVVEEILAGSLLLAALDARLLLDLATDVVDQLHAVIEVQRCITENRAENEPTSFLLL
jgi:hypothetical protein